MTESAADEALDRAPTETILDAVLPRFDVVLAEHLVVGADPGDTLQAVQSLDLLTVRSPLLDASMWLRGLPARLSGTAVPVAPRVVVGEGGLPGWLVLGESGSEFAFVAVGRFWQPVIEWYDVTGWDAERFAAFDEPGWGKIAANFSVRPYGHGTLLSYECRTATTDSVAQRRFLRYWWLIRPFVGHIMRATLRTVKTNIE
ncbi:hypothetical protein [Mycolicibacterium palauense]|uniref:hypothetical protein n=1 Tax=Mycolicibacterium palauense TaxID=2034511 RepID=UPI000BFEB1E4|nr:hypothetical protein [Mycolicibacterium palauense]